MADVRIHPAAALDGTDAPHRSPPSKTQATRPSPPKTTTRPSPSSPTPSPSTPPTTSSSPTAAPPTPASASGPRRCRTQTPCVLPRSLCPFGGLPDMFFRFQCIKANPTWSKGYARKGAALHGAHKFDDAIAAYEEGLKLEDSPALRKGLKEVQEARGTYALSASRIARLTPCRTRCNGRQRQ